MYVHDKKKIKNSTAINCINLGRLHDKDGGLKILDFSYRIEVHKMIIISTYIVNYLTFL